MSTAAQIDELVEAYRGTVCAQYLDRMGHMNIQRFVAEMREAANGEVAAVMRTTPFSGAIVARARTHGRLSGGVR